MSPASIPNTTKCLSRQAAVLSSTSRNRHTLPALLPFVVIQNGGARLDQPWQHRRAVGSQPKLPRTPFRDSFRVSDYTVYERGIRLTTRG